MPSNFLRSNFLRSLLLPQTMRKIVWLAALLLHAASSYYAGSFWLDEADSISVARMAWPQIWQSLAFDTFPLAHVVLFKFWLGIFGFWTPETALRWLAFGIGAGIATTFYAFGKRFAANSAPLFFALFQLNPAIARYIGSARPYGLSALLLALLLYNALVALENGRRRHIWLAILAAFGAAHSHYFNVLGVAAVLFALLLAMRRKDGFHRDAARQMAIGLALSLLSMAMYAPQLQRAAAWLPLTRHLSRDLGAPFFALNWLLNGMSTAPAYFWIFGVALASLLLMIQARSTTGSMTTGPIQRAQAEFLLLSAGGASVLLWAAMLANGTIASPWYFIPTLALVCLGLEPAWERFQALPRAQIVLGCSVITIALLQIAGSWTMLQQPMATIDRAAILVARQATAHDLVIVAPWPSGVTFDFYYQGAAPFITVPPLAEYHIVRHDMAEKGMLQTDFVLSKLETTLRRGGQVFVVGELEAAPPSKAAMEMGSVRDAFAMKRAARAAEAQVTAYLNQHAREPETLAPQTECFSSECPSVQLYEPKMRR